MCWFIICWRTSSRLLPLNLEYRVWRKEILISWPLLTCFMIRILFYLQLVSAHLNPDGILNLIGFSVLIPFLSFLSSFTASRSFILIVCILYVNLLLSSPEIHLFISGIISVLSISSNCFLMTFSANCWYFVRFQPIYYKLIYHSSICAKSFGLSPVLNATAHHSFLVFISLIGKSESLAISFQPNALT